MERGICKYYQALNDTCFQLASLQFTPISPENTDWISTVRAAVNVKQLQQDDSGSSCSAALIVQ